MREMPSSAAITVPAPALRALIARMFVASGLAQEAAARVAEGLVEADLEGMPSHGAMLVDMYLERIRVGSVSMRTSAEVISDREAAVVLDAGHALSQER